MLQGCACTACSVSIMSRREGKSQASHLHCLRLILRPINFHALVQEDKSPSASSSLALNVIREAQPSEGR